MGWVRRGQQLAGGSQLVRRSTRRCPVVASCTRPAATPLQCGVSGMTQLFQTFAVSSSDGGSLRESSCSFVAVWQESERPRYIPLDVPLPAASTSQPRLILSPLQPVGGTAQAAASAAVSALLVLLELQ